MMIHITAIFESFLLSAMIFHQFTLLRIQFCIQTKKRLSVLSSDGYKFCSVYAEDLKIMTILVNEINNNKGINSQFKNPKIWATYTFKSYLAFYGFLQVLVYPYK